MLPDVVDMLQFGKQCMGEAGRKGMKIMNGCGNGTESCGEVEERVEVEQHVRVSYSDGKIFPEKWIK